MNKIYAIRKDAPNYKQLDLGILDITRHAPNTINLDDIYEFSKNNTAMKSWWKKPETKFIDYGGEPPSLLPDISCWIDATLVLSPKAYRMLGELLQPSGEFLPVLVRDETYHIFNCLVPGEADEKNSVFEYVNGNRFGLEHLEFMDSASELLVFKSTLQSCLTLFCNERFKNAVEGFGLQGIIFDTNLIQIYD